MENITQEHQCYDIYISWKNGQTAKQIHQELRVTEGPNSLSECIIYWWVETFKDGDESIERWPPLRISLQSCHSKKDCKSGGTGK